MKEAFGFILTFIAGMAFGVLVTCQWISINKTVEQNNKTDYTITLKVVEE